MINLHIKNINNAVNKTIVKEIKLEAFVSLCQGVSIDIVLNGSCFPVFQCVIALR